MAFTKITSTNIAENTVAGYAEFANIANSLAPKITSIAITSNTYSVLDDTAVNVGGGFIVVTGTEFQSGATVLIDTTPATSVSYIDNTTLRAQVPAKTAASYNLYVVNPDGGTGIKVAGITYSGSPTWVTTSPLANVISNTVFSGTFNATGASTYANTTILPTGFNLLANGYYFGNISVGTTTTYNFNIRATDAENQDSDKTFSLTAVNVLPTYSVNYLVVAGGGGGGGGNQYGTGSGAGAGGLLTGNLTMTTGATYTVTVGSGGALGTGYPTNAPILGVGGNGTPSSITGAPITSLIVYGGGGGVNYFVSGNPPGSWSGTPGGSGSGANGTPSDRLLVGQGFNFPGPTQQGYPGGTGIFYDSAPYYVSGGGGGAGAVGGSAPTNFPRALAGPGGAGYTWSLTGSTYAGGGGAGSGEGPSSFRGTGGPGGGGAGGYNGPSYPGVSGITNTGGGGGGGGGSPAFTNPGGSGGSGVVILAIPTPSYPGSAPGATVSTPPAAPGKTIVTFTNSGTYTA
jgi:hypothetical protein